MTGGGATGLWSVRVTGGGATGPWSVRVTGGGAIGEAPVAVSHPGGLLACQGDCGPTVAAANHLKIFME